MKQVFRLLSLLVLTVTLVVLTGSACKKESPPPPDRVWLRGEFKPLDENTKDYSLPDGITVDSLYGSIDSSIPESDLPLYMQVSSTKSGDTKVTFPAGLIFNPQNPEIEYMMMLQDFTFTANAGVTDSIYVPVYGCNVDLDEPDDETHFTTAGIEWDKETQELLDLVADKALNTPEAIDLAQQALSEITEDSTGLTDSTRTHLKALPSLP
jgi:hypothetical protein